MRRRIRWMALASAAVVAVVGTSIWAAEADAEGWDTSLSIGGSATRGNSETLTVNASLIGGREWERHEGRLGLEGSYATAEDSETGEDEPTAQNAKAFAKYKYKFKPRWYAYTDDSIFHDDLAGLDYRLILGVGLGAFALDNDTAKLGIELGGAYLREDFSDDTEDDAIALRVAARHDQVLSETAKAWASAEYLPKTEDFEDYLLNAELGTEAVINSRMSLRMVLQNRYDNAPAADQEKSDLSLVGSLVYRL